MLELVEEDGPPLSGFVSEGGEDGVAEVLLDGFTVALVQITRPVVGGALGAHVVACSVGCQQILRSVSNTAKANSVHKPSKYDKMDTQ